MANWSQILTELAQSPRKDALDYTRVKYLKRLHKKTGRNVICYYSAFLQKPELRHMEITDEDKNGFMTAVHGLDRTKGLDLFLHTPGGQTAATESIVDYLRQMFGMDIRAVIPQISMSAGTMIACSCKDIVMGKQSNLGPIDPQFGGIPAQGVLEEFQQAIVAIKKDPASIPMWQVIIGKYHPTFLGDCQKAIDMSEQLVQRWLESCMFSQDADAKARAAKIVADIGSHSKTKMHARHIHMDEAKDMGLKIVSLETDCDQEYQDLVLTIHHTYMHTFAQSTSVRIVENQNGQRVVTHLKVTK